MRITYLHQYFTTPTMAGGTRSFEMARRLVAMGHDVSMITTSRGLGSSGGWHTTMEAGIEVHWYANPYSNGMSYPQRVRSFARFAVASAWKASRIPADLVFASSTPLSIAFPGNLASAAQGVPFVFEVRDLWPEVPIAVGAIKNWFLKSGSRGLADWSYRNAASIVALSPGMADGVNKAGFPRERIAVIPNSCDPEFASCDRATMSRFRSSRPWLGHSPFIVYAGTFGLLNGVEYAVDLACELREQRSDVRLLLVGDGGKRSVVEEYAKMRGVLGENLFIEAELPKREMPALFASASFVASLFVDLPEMRVNSANKFFDALAAGKPVLLNYGGWMHDLVKNYGCGLPMWRQPIAKVAAAVHEASHSPEWLTRAGAASRDLGKRFFARDDLARQLERVLVATQQGSSHLARAIAPGVYF